MVTASPAQTLVIAGEARVVALAGHAASDEADTGPGFEPGVDHGELGGVTGEESEAEDGGRGLRRPRLFLTAGIEAPRGGFLSHRERGRLLCFEACSEPFPWRPS